LACFAFAFAILVALCSAQGDSIFDCTKPTTDGFPSSGTGTIACSGYKANVVHKIVPGFFANCSFAMVSYTSVYGDLSLWDGSNKVLTWTSTAGTATDVKNAIIVLTPNKDYGGSDFKIQYTCAQRPSKFPIVNLVSGQTQYISNQSNGGFVYFSVGQQSDGASQSYNFNVVSYSGLHPPNFFVAMNRLPALESYDFTNDTVATGNRGYTWQWSQANPNGGTPYIGMFLYGTFGSAYVMANWTFAYETIPFNTPISRTLNNQQWCGQFYVSQKVLSYNLQVSRQEPGGYPVFYVAAGNKPSVSNAAYTLDTNQNSFSQITVKSPFYPKGANPGTWIVCTQPAFTGAFYIGVNI
jgi:hypothetical protein